MSEWRPTGNKRHRSQRRWGREELVLQIEERGLVTYFQSGFADTDYVNRWRDAKTTDFAYTLPTPPETENE